MNINMFGVAMNKKLEILGKIFLNKKINEAKAEVYVISYDVINLVILFCLDEEETLYIEWRWGEDE